MVHVIAALPGALVGVAGVEQAAEPLTTDESSPLTKPVNETVSAGFAAPYARACGSGTTARATGVTDSVPATKLMA